MEDSSAIIAENYVVDSYFIVSVSTVEDNSAIVPGSPVVDSYVLARVFIVYRYLFSCSGTIGFSED